MTKDDIKKMANEFIENYKETHPDIAGVEESYLWEGYINGAMDVAYKNGLIILTDNK